MKILLREADNLAYITFQKLGILAIDITDLQKPFIVDRMFTFMAVKDIDVSAANDDRYLISVNGEEGMAIYDRRIDFVFQT